MFNRLLIPLLAFVALIATPAQAASINYGGSATVVGVVDENGNPITAANPLDVSGTVSDTSTGGNGIAQPTGGTGVQGWLSGIYDTLVTASTQPNTPVAVFGNSYTHISTATTTVVKSGAGTLRGITINTTAAGAVTLYDNTAGSGTVIAIFPASAAIGTYTYDIAFGTGLTIVTAGASDITVSYR